jgi:hypothetical protein
MGMLAAWAVYQSAIAPILEMLRREICNRTGAELRRLAHDPRPLAPARLCARPVVGHFDEITLQPFPERRALGRRAVHEDCLVHLGVDFALRLPLLSGFRDPPHLNNGTA